MTSITDEVLATVLGDAPVDSIDADRIDEAIDDPDDGALLCALLLDTPGLLDRFAETLSTLPDPDDPMAPRRIAVAAELQDPGVDDQIDDWLADPDRATPAVRGLLLADIDWHHPALTDLLDDRKAGFGAAWLLARTAPGDLEEALEDIENDSRRIELIRAAALAGEPEWFSALLDWREHLADDLSRRHLSYLDGALATVSPLDYAHKLLMGEIGDDWVGDDRAVADFLARHGATTWITTLAVFRHVRDIAAFELAATFAVASAVTSPFDDVDDDRLAPEDAADWLERDPSRLSLPMALTDDTELTELLVESTLHHALLQRDVAPPPIAGLPLSGPSVEAEDLDELFAPIAEFSDDEPRGRVQRIRTLLDLLGMVQRGECEPETAQPFFERFDDGDAAELVRQLFESRQPVGTHDDWGCRGLDAATWQFDRRPEDALRALADGWFRAPPERIAPWHAAFTAVRTERSDRD